MIFASFMYEKNSKEVTSYKYLGVDLHVKVNWNYIIERRINGGWKDYYGL